jgi:hypothetical protein
MHRLPIALTLLSLISTGCGGPGPDAPTAPSAPTPSPGDAAKAQEQLNKQPTKINNATE